MDTETLFADLQLVKEANDNFSQKHGEEILQIVEKEDMTAEESLIQEILLELSEKMERVSQIIEYLGMEITEEGMLNSDDNGTILFNGKKLPLMKEIEVYIHDEELQRNIWTRTFISISDDGEFPYLAGLDQRLEINRMRARIRGSK